MSDTLQNPAALQQGEKLTSHNMANHLVMQSDGNVVLYGNALITSQNARWSSKTNTHSPAGPYRLVMQDDGNLVAYDGHHHAIWASDTMLKGNSPHRSVVQDDGNLVIYDAHHKPTWATNTNH